MGHRNKRIGRVVARGGEGGIRQGRYVQVLGKILREHFFAKDFLQECFVTRPENNRVVAQLGILLAISLKAKVNHHQRHRLLGELDAPIAIPEAVLFVDELLVGSRPVSIGHD